MTSTSITTYQSYKEKTTKIAQWLLETAEQTGCQIKQRPIQPGNKAQPKTQLDSPFLAANKPKIKSDKEEVQKDQHRIEVQCSSTSKGHQPVYDIRLSQFVELARAIAQKVDHVSKIPRTIIRLIRQTIDLRRRVSRFYQLQANCGQNRRSSSEDDVKHIYFIERLEEVLEVLEPNQECENENVQNHRGMPAKVDAHHKEPANIYEALRAHEYDEISDIQQEPVRQPAPQKQENRPIARYDDKETKGDKCELDFAIFCFFEDLGRVREYMNQTWKEYSRGEIDLATASLVTNTTFVLVRKAEEEFLDSIGNFLEPESRQNLIHSLYLLLCVSNGIDIYHREQADDLFNYQMKDIGQFLYFPVFCLLEGFTKVIGPDQIPQPRIGHHGLYNPQDDRADMSFRQQINEDKVLIAELLPEFCMVHHTGCQYLQLDELARGLGQMHKTRSIPIWIVFATQVFLDIHHSLRCAVEQPFDEAQRLGRRAKGQLNSVSSSLHGKDSITIEKCIKFIEDWLLSDGVDRSKRRFFGRKYHPSNRAFWLLKNHPLLCGSVALFINLLLHETGTTLMMRWPVTLYVAHMYRGLLAHGSVELWPEMESFISTYKASALLIGSTSASLHECMKRYDLMAGASIQNFASGRQKRQTIRRSQSSRQWLTESQLLLMCKDWYSDSRTKPTSDSVCKIIESSNRMRKKRPKSEPTIMCQTPGLLKKAMTNESLTLSFDHISFHLKCDTILRGIGAELQGQLTIVSGSKYQGREDQLLDIAAWVLLAASKTEEVHGKVCKELVSESCKILRHIFSEL